MILFGDARGWPRGVQLSWVLAGVIGLPNREAPPIPELFDGDAVGVE